MGRVYPPKPISCGILLSYKCTSVCRHCMYSCSPSWSDDWISEGDLSRILGQLSGSIAPAPGGSSRIGVNYGLHFTGGEPFLNYRLLLRAVELAEDYDIPSIFVETNCFWCASRERAEEMLLGLRRAGLDGVLISVNPFLVEYTPFERMVLAAELAERIFDGGLIIYQREFYDQFRRIGLRGTMSFEEYLARLGVNGLRWAELLPMGRACYKLRELFRRYPAKVFFDEDCRGSLLRSWHAHIDNYGNLITGYCAGLSLGDARRLDELVEGGLDLDERPILGMLILEDLGSLYRFAVKEYNYVERSDGYISKCDLCLDIRRHIVEQAGADEYPELAPREFYRHLEEERRVR